MGVLIVIGNPILPHGPCISLEVPRALRRNSQLRTAQEKRYPERAAVRSKMNSKVDYAVAFEGNQISKAE